MRTPFLCFCSILVFAPLAQAQERPAAAVLETQASASVDAETAGAVDRMIRARLDGLGVVQTSSGVALDLSDIQLALGCVGETPECLGPVADELSVQLLLIPSLDLTDGQLLLTIALFDRPAGTMRRVVRQASGERARADLLDMVEGALRELFGLPAPAESETGSGAAGGGASEQHEPPPEVSPPPPSGPSAGSFVVMGLGVAAVGVGIGMGVAFLDARAEWESARPNDVASADAANAAYDRAQAFAFAADILYVAGGLAIAGGLAWLLIDLFSQPGRTDTAVAPIVTPNTVGLVARGQWEAP